MLSQKGIFADPEPNTLLYEGRTRSRGYVQLPKLVLYARNLSRDAKLLYVVLLGYAWQKQRCFPGYKRLCADMDASENMVRKYMRELEAVHLLSQHRRGQGRSNMYFLHDLRTANIEVQDHHKIAVLEPQESEDNEETVEVETEEIQRHRTIGERPVRKSPGNAENDEKALVGGEPAGSGMVTPIGSRWSPTPLRHAPARGEQAKEQDASSRDQALAQAKAMVGAAIEERLRELGGSNPAGGAKTILEALVEVQTPLEVLGALLEVGERRLEQQQEREHISNPTGYLIGIMRNLAVEGMLKRWNVTQMRAEDDEKRAQAVRSAAQAGNRLLTYDGPALPPEGESTPEVPPGADTASTAALAPNVPEGVQVAEVAECGLPSAAPPQVEEEQGETWLNRLRPTVHDSSGVERSVAMYWGFAREAILASPMLSQARKWHLEGIRACAIDPEQPRVLFLLCTSGTAARFIECSLLREIEAQREKLLWHEFDAVQVESVPRLPSWAARREEDYQEPAV